MILILFLLALFVVIEIISWFIFGLPTKTPPVDLNFFGAYASHSTGFISNGYFISKAVPTFLTKWYIVGYGRIPRWTKVSKQLDLKFKELKIVKRIDDEINQR